MRSVRSPAGSSLAELDFIWQVSGDNGMTGLFPWKHICHFYGARPKCCRGIATENCRTGGKINHTNDDSKRELRQNVKITPASLVSLCFPWNWNLAGCNRVFFGWFSSDIIFQIIWCGCWKGRKADRRGDASAVESCEDVAVAVWLWIREEDQ